jgi:hypothetical protein
MKDVLLYFESFDTDYNDVYIAVSKPWFSETGEQASGV